MRLATADDVENVVSVIRPVYDEYNFTWDPAEYHADLYDLQAHYLDHGWPFWIMEIDGRAVGTVALTQHQSVPGELGTTIEVNDKVRVAGTDCELNRLYVHPDARRQGIGEELTKIVIDEAKRRGCRAMELWSDKRFGDAHRLYGRFGARVVGDRICDDPDVSPEWGLLIEL